MKNRGLWVFIGAMLLLLGCHQNSSGNMEPSSFIQTENTERDETDIVPSQSGYEEDQTAGNTQNTQSTQNTQENKGVYYPAIDPVYISDGYAGGQLGSVLLYYAGNIYSREYMVQEDIQSEDVDLDMILGKKLGVVYGDIAHWSQNQNDLGYIRDLSGKYTKNYEFGTLYTVQGYDADYALCIVHSREHMDPTVYIPYENPIISFFYKENGIWLDKGADLFCDRMQLDQSAVLMQEKEEDGSTALYPFEEDVRKTILNALFEGDFAAEDELPDLSYAENRSIYLCKGEVFKRELIVFDNDYVSLGNGLYLHCGGLWDCLKEA